MADGGIDEAVVARLPVPCYVVDERMLEANLAILDAVQDKTGAKILLALKAFATFATFSTIKGHLHGTCASGLYEARLGKERFGKEVHVYAPAYRDADFDEIVKIADHVVFNSLQQWDKYERVVAASPRKVSCGLRVNPGYSEIQTPLYDPCAPSSRLGIPIEGLAAIPPGIEGLHFHCLCEQGPDVLERVFAVFETKLTKHFRSLKWLNLGGGHLITKPGYDVDRLCRLLARIKGEYGVEVYLEPGEAVVYNAGFLVASVVDVITTGRIPIAVLDTSATAHMPDVLEMPYRPDVVGAGRPGDFPFDYTLGGISCLAGDVIGSYSFPNALGAGDRVVFTDMAHYTMVKNNMFNGIPLPSIVYLRRSGEIDVVKRFGYDEYVRRLS